jgi:hypothetical protein
MKVVVFVNGDRFELTSDETTVGYLIQLGGGTPGQYELEERKGERGPVIHAYTDPAQTIHVHDGEHFTTKYTGPINPS